MDNDKKVLSSRNSRISKIKPEAEQKPKPNIEWNDKDIKAHQDIGLDPPSDICKWELRFLNEVDTRKGEIERTVTRMIRLRAPDYEAAEATGNKKPEMKEWIYYEEDWEGKNIQGIPMYVRGHIEGYYTRQSLRPHLNKQTGEVQYMEIDPTSRGRKLTYTIPWNKKTIDDIIANSTHTDKNNIRYVIKFGISDSTELGYNARMATRSQFSYEQFATWDWEDVYNFHVAPTGNFWDKKAKQYKTVGQKLPTNGSHIT